MRVWLGSLAAVLLLALLLAGCGEGTKTTGSKRGTTTTASSRIPETDASCISAWDHQGEDLAKESVTLSVVEDDNYEAWVSVYEGKPTTWELPDGQKLSLSGSHCLVAVPSAGAVYAYVEGSWGPRGEPGGPLYEYATDPATGRQAEVVKGVHLVLRPESSDANLHEGMEIEDASGCIAAWNAQPASDRAAALRAAEGGSGGDAEAVVGLYHGEDVPINTSGGGTWTLTEGECVVAFLPDRRIYAFPARLGEWELASPSENGFIALSRFLEQPGAAQRARLHGSDLEASGPSNESNGDAHREPHDEAGHSPVRAVELGLRSHFDYLEDGAYEKAYEGLTHQEGQALGGEAKWIADQRQDRLTNHELSVKVEFEGADRAKAAIDEFRTRSQGAGCQSWSGAWEMADEGGHWLINGADLEAKPCG